MTILINIAAIAVFTLLVIGVVWIVLRAFLNRDPDAQETRTAPDPRPVRTRWLLGIGGFLLCGMFISCAYTAQIAFGAPMGERTTPVLEVVEVRQCGRPIVGLGLVRLCELTVYESEAPLYSFDFPDVITSAGVVEPGDRVARYSPSGWVRALQFIGGEPQWRSLEDTGKPNLVWLQAAALVLGLLVLKWLDERLRARHRTTPEANEVR
ncbi:hypothetical protein [Glycomyces arizonensis]|uniref:hypothetical protein n=1 Tax=Glycomyces arizonensis TaxID=256035 RepID=UPI00041E55BD|nr:hypothetical protein [Glycomyces arizonensis]